MDYRIDEIEGIGPVNKEKLGDAGIQTTRQLLDQCASAKGRQDASGKSGLTTSQLLVFANMADLMRLGGIGCQFAELLKAAGVDTVKELATRNADNLATKLAELNAEKKLAKSVPSLGQVQDWIASAKETAPLITH